MALLTVPALVLALLCSVFEENENQTKIATARTGRMCRSVKIGSSVCIQNMIAIDSSIGQDHVYLLLFRYLGAYVKI
jgi:hypothetical protein